MHRRPQVYRDDAFGHWGTVSQSAVRSDGVVIAASSLDQDQYGWQGRLAGQRLSRELVAVHQIRASGLADLCQRL